MADLEFYRSQYGIITPIAAFEHFAGTLQNYYDANFYVDWPKVYANVKRFKPELLLLSSLCGEKDKVTAAKELLCRFPQIISALPILIGYRGSVQLVENAEEARVITYDFTSGGLNYTDAEIDYYVEFMLSSNLLNLLDHIQSVPDYVTGVEVGMDTNGRKNRGGDCGERAIFPFVEHVRHTIPGVSAFPQVTYDRLASEGCILPRQFEGVRWDWAFWTEKRPRRFTVMEVNHYGSSGSKPAEVARDYISRQPVLDASGVGFIWVTDGLGWTKMRNPLREAFTGIHHLVNIKLASEGLLEWAVQQTLFPSYK